MGKQANLLACLILGLLLLPPSSSLFAMGKKGQKIKEKAFLTLRLDNSGWGDWFQIFFSDWQTRDLTSYQRLVFYVKVIEPGDVSDLAVALSAEGQKPVSVPLERYAQLSSEKWVKVQIPLVAFKDLDRTKIHSFIFQRGNYPAIKVGLDEISFEGDEEPILMWGDADQHWNMQQTGGTKVEYEIVPKGGK
jgi:hypothetical protein